MMRNGTSFGRHRLKSQSLTRLRACRDEKISTTENRSKLTERYCLVSIEGRKAVFYWRSQTGEREGSTVPPRTIDTGFVSGIFHSIGIGKCRFTEKPWGYLLVTHAAGYLSAAGDSTGALSTTLTTQDQLSFSMSVQFSTTAHRSGGKKTRVLQPRRNPVKR